jgi:hypothetical protein
MVLKRDKKRANRCQKGLIHNNADVPITHNMEGLLYWDGFPPLTNTAISCRLNLHRNDSH